jgi:hypothetical protein
MRPISSRFKAIPFVKLGREGCQAPVPRTSDWVGRQQHAGFPDDGSQDYRGDRFPGPPEGQLQGKTKVAVTFDPLDVLNFIKHDFMPMNLMCDRAEMFERRIYDRSKAVFEYFGLPFDAEPPP